MKVSPPTAIKIFFQLLLAYYFIFKITIILGIGSSFYKYLFISLSLQTSIFHGQLLLLNFYFQDRFFLIIVINFLIFLLETQFNHFVQLFIFSSDHFLIGYGWIIIVIMNSMIN